MDYVTLLKNGASDVKLQTHPSQGNKTTITIRVPKNLKDSCAEIAVMSGLNKSTYVHSCLIRVLTDKR